MRKYFHRTTDEAAASILAHGFQDAEECYRASELHSGVWLADVPLDCNEGSAAFVSQHMRMRNAGTVKGNTVSAVF